MSLEVADAVMLTEVASFSSGSFLENIAVRRDGSILVTVLFARELWCIPSFREASMQKPARVHAFELGAMSVVETEPDIFHVTTTSIGRGNLHRLDMRGWSPGKSMDAELVVDFRDCGWLNGSCLIAPKVLLIADSFTSSIWRVDLAADGRSGKGRCGCSTRAWRTSPRGRCRTNPA